MKMKGKEERQMEQQRINYRAESEEFFDDSPEPVPREKIEDYDEIGKICEKEREQLMSRKEEMKKTLKNEENYREEKSSSQFLPNSGVSFQNEDSGSFHSSRVESDSQINLDSVLKKYQKQLTDPRERQQTINEIAQITKQSVQLVKRKVHNFIKKQKASRSKPAEVQLDHQTIYRKTEMFDDAIKRVLKVTPYACINDLKEQINVKLGLDLAKETLIRRLKNLNYTYTKFTLQKKEFHDDPKINLMRQQFYFFYHHMMQRRYPIYFYGYCHIALDQCKGSMWMKTKQNMELDHTIHEKDVISISLIIQENRIEFYRIFEGFYCRQNYHRALVQWAKSRHEAQSREHKHRTHKKSQKHSEQNRVYLMSEASQIHNEGSLLQDSQLSSLLRSRSIQLIAFPPYSYSLNPAEQLFNQLKFVVKSKAKNIDIHNFISTVHQAIANNIDVQDIKFAYRKANKSFYKWHDVKRE